MKIEMTQGRVEDIYAAAYRMKYYGYREDWMDELLTVIAYHLPAGTAERLQEEVIREE